MTVSKSAQRLKEMISKAIEDHKITREEYDTIIHLATEDNMIDNQEQALLSQLHDMIEDKTIRLVPK